MAQAIAALRIGMLSILYAVMLLAVIIAFQAQQQQTGAFQINFEYRMF